MGIPIIRTVDGKRAAGSLTDAQALQAEALRSTGNVTGECGNRIVGGWAEQTRVLPGHEMLPPAAALVVRLKLILLLETTEPASRLPKFVLFGDNEKVMLWLTVAAEAYGPNSVLVNMPCLAASLTS